jgi:hypothetical protein
VVPGSTEVGQATLDERNVTTKVAEPVAVCKLLQEAESTNWQEGTELPQCIELACPAGDLGMHFVAMMDEACAAELVGNGKYYGVALGRKVGVYSSWAITHAQTNKFSGACQKSFATVELALRSIMEYSIYLGTEGDIPQFDNDNREVARWRYVREPGGANRWWELVRTGATDL